MNNYWKIYWITRLDSISDLFSALLFIGTLLCVVIGILSMIDGVENDFDTLKKYQKIPKIILVVMLISGFFKVFIPNQTQTIAILAGGATLDYAQKDSSLSKIPYQTTQLVTKYLEKQIESVEKEAK